MQQSREEVHWQPIDQVFVIGNLVHQQMEVATGQLALLREARPKPHILTDEIMARIDTLFSGARQFIGIYEEQCLRWRRENELDVKQGAEISRIEGLLPRWSEMVEEILALHGEMKGRTIEKVLDKDDYELGLEALMTGADDMDEELVSIAERIDRGVSDRLETGGNEAVLTHMIDYMADFKRLMDGAGEHGLLVLTAKFEGLAYFTRLLEHMAEAIQTGELKAPGQPR